MPAHDSLRPMLMPNLPIEFSPGDSSEGIGVGVSPGQLPDRVRPRRAKPRTMTRLPSPARRIQLTVFSPCPHEGAIVEWCNSCTSGGKHVRDCSHPDNQHERCTREPMGGIYWNCQSCPHRPNEETQMIPQPTPAQSPPIRKAKVRIACGMTTVESRRASTLPVALASIRATGFDPQIFVDGSSDLLGYVKEFGGTISVRGANLKAFGNWVLGMWELLIRNPTATHYLMFQDDCVVVKGLREYLEGSRLPDQAYGNLYTFPPTIRRGTGLWQEAPPAQRGWYRSNQRGMGAVALYLPKEALIKVLSDQGHIVERPLHSEKGDRGIDGAVVSALAKGRAEPESKKWWEAVHHPSLVQHIGLESSIGNRKWPQAESFPGEDWDARELLK